MAVPSFAILPIRHPRLHMPAHFWNILLLWSVRARLVALDPVAFMSNLCMVCILHMVFSIFFPGRAQQICHPFWNPTLTTRQRTIRKV